MCIPRWRDLTANALDEAYANGALAEKRDRARKRRVNRIDASTRAGPRGATPSRRQKTFRADERSRGGAPRYRLAKNASSRFARAGSAARASHSRWPVPRSRLAEPNRPTIFSVRIVRVANARRSPSRRVVKNAFDRRARA